jgi:hypothetical protein
VVAVAAAVVVSSTVGLAAGAPERTPSAALSPATAADSTVAPDPTTVERASTDLDPRDRRPAGDRFAGDRSASAQPESPRIRVVHVSPLVPPVDATVENEPFDGTLSFGEVSPYRAVEFGEDDYELEVERADTGDEILDTDVGLDDGVDYTLAVAARSTSGGVDFRPVLLTDDATAPAAGTASLRLVHAGADAPDLDVTLSTDAGDGTALRGLSFRQDSEYVRTSADAVQVAVRATTQNGSGAPLATFDVPLSAGTAHTLYLTGFLDPEASVEEPLTVLVTRDAGTGADDRATAVEATSYRRDVLGGAPTAEERAPRLRVLHVSPGLPGLDVTVENDPVADTVAFGDVSQYRALEPDRDDYELEVVLGDSGETVFDRDVELDGLTNYTLLAVSRPGGDGPFQFVPSLLRDEFAGPGRGLPGFDRAAVRFVHAVPDAPGLDLVVRERGRTVAENVTFRDDGRYVTLPAGTYTFEVRRASTDAVLTTRTVSLAGGTASSVVALGFLDPGAAGVDAPLATAVTTDAARERPATASQQNGTTLRVLHVSPLLPSVDLSADGDSVATNVSFADVSNYRRVGPGSTPVSVRLNATGEEVFAERPTLEPNLSYTVLAVATPGENGTVEFVPSLLRDGFRVPPPGQTAVRFVHAVSDAPALDLTTADGRVLADNVTFRDDGPYVLLPAGNYTLEVRRETPENDGEVLASRTVALGDGVVTTAVGLGFLDGEAAGAEFPLAIGLTRDATRETAGGTPSDGGADGATDGGPDVAAVRVVHVSPVLPSLDVSGGLASARNVSFGDVTDYQGVEPGPTPVSVRLNATGEEVFADELTFEANLTYTVLAVAVPGENGTVEFVPSLLRDGFRPPAEDRAKLRFVHGVPDVPAVDVTTADGELVADDVQFRDDGPYVTLAPGNYTLQVRRETPGNDGAVLANRTVELAPGTVTSAFGLGFADPAAAGVDFPVSVAVTTDASRSD